MTSIRAPGRVPTAALLLAALCTSLPASGADLASTYAHDAFPSAVTTPEPARRPCSQARLARRSRAARKPAGAIRHGSSSPGSSRPSERPGVVTIEEEPKPS